VVVGAIPWLRFDRQMISHENSFRPERIAAEVHELWRTGRQIDLLSARYPTLAVPDAYRAAFALRRLHEADGHRTIGRKLAFTNRTLWPRYNVTAPSWGYVYDSTCFDLSEAGRQVFSLRGIQEPRIEPEIIFGFESAPRPGMSEDEVLACIGWVAHGFEIVHSIFPGWRFTGADTIIGSGLHAALFLGPKQPPTGTGWQDALQTFTVKLFRDGVFVTEGSGANVLGSPLVATKHFNDGLGTEDALPQLAAGELVSTGTLTDAIPIFAGETWQTSLTGLPLPGIRLRFEE
jgi:2-oxo-3-hexenedioate decarboxylase